MTAIELIGAGKRYWQLEQDAMLLRSVLPFARPKRHELWALRDVDLRIEQGETVGILGRNGAGKTTLLRMLAGVTQPSVGTAIIRGRVAPLIGVGVGFHQEMSGRENVFVNGMLLGLSKQQIEERFDDIVAFSELSEFIDTPVKFYSSGMFMRLGFSVAIHVDPQVLLVDEVLAVGDLAFQAKCFDRMRELQSSGTTVVIVSHAMAAIRVLCPRALLFRHGELVLDGDPESVIAKHHELLSVEGQGGTKTPVVGGVKVVDRQIIDESGNAVHSAGPEQPLRYQVRLRFERDVEDPLIFFTVQAENGALAYEMKPPVGRQHHSYAAGDEAVVDIPFVPRLGGGSYRLAITVTAQDAREVHFRDLQGTMLYLSPRFGSGGIADLEASIFVDGTEISDHDDPMLGSSAVSPPAAS